MLWDALVTPKTKAELTAHLAAEFPEVANTAVQTDVEEFITAVLEPGLIELETH